MTTHPAVFVCSWTICPGMIPAVTLADELAARLLRLSIIHQLSAINRVGSNTRERVGNASDLALLRNTFDRMN